MKYVFFILPIYFVSFSQSNGQTRFDDLISYELEVSTLIDLGYLEANVIQTSDTVFIEKGDVFTINSVLISPDSLELDRFYSGFKELICSKSAISDLIKVVSDNLIKEMRFMARVNQDSIHINKETKKVDIYLSVDSCEIQVKPILDFIGSKRYSDDYIKKVAGFSNSTFSQNFSSDSERLRFRLIRSGLFSSVSTVELFKNDSLINAVFRLQEQNPNRFDLIAGYIPTNDGGGQFVGSIDFDLVNMIREGQILSFRFNRMQSFRTRLKIAASQHFIANSNFSAGLEFNLFQRDSTFQSQNWIIKSGYELNAFSTVEVFVKRDEIGAGLNATQYYTDGTAYFYGFSYLLDTTDDLFIPTKGVKLLLSSEIGVKKNTDLVEGTIFPEKENKQRFSLEFEWLYSPIKRTVLSTKVQGNYLLSDFFQDSDLFRFGGASSLRGFGEEQFASSKSAWTDFEYRFLLDRTSYVFGFYSIGAYEIPELINDAGKVNSFSEKLQSFGFGLAYRTRLGLLSFTYAKSPQDSFDNAKIHFGIKGGL